MFSKKYPTFMAVICVAGCAGADQVGPEVPLPQAAQQVVMQSAANQMKDPNGAEFRNWHAFESQNGLIVCGEINAKNSFGGYVGFTHFIAHASPDGHLLVRATLSSTSGSGPDPLIDSIWRQYYPGCY